MTVSNTIFLTRNSEWSIPQTVCYFFQPFKSICKLIFGISKKIFNWADKKYMVSEGYFTFEWISGLCFLTNSLILQVIYFTLSQVGWSRHAPLVFHLTDVPVPSMIIIFLWPIVALAICELFKRRYIK